jgi:large subunit ribosomal protein L22
MVVVAEAEARFVRSSPRKVRLVIDLIRGKQVDEALTLLKYTPKAAARIVMKLLNSAVANALQEPGVRTDELYVKEAWVNPGPTLKRVRPRAMGRAMLIRKRMCHVKIILDQV